MQKYLIWGNLQFFFKNCVGVFSEESPALKDCCVELFVSLKFLTNDKEIASLHGWCNVFRSTYVICGVIHLIR